MTKFEIIATVVGVLAVGGATWKLFSIVKRFVIAKFNEIHARFERLTSQLRGMEIDLAAKHTAVLEKVNAVESNVIDAGDVVATSIKTHLDAHKEELKENADRLRAHAQQLHDEAQARNGSRTVPTR